MAQFVAFALQVEVSGAAIELVVAGLPDEARNILSKYGLYPVENEGGFRSRCTWMHSAKLPKVPSMPCLI